MGQVETDGQVNGGIGEWRNRMEMGWEDEEGKGLKKKEWQISGKERA
jgi:hypothetical protein